MKGKMKNKGRKIGSKEGRKQLAWRLEQRGAQSLCDAWRGASSHHIWWGPHGPWKCWERHQASEKPPCPPGSHPREHPVICVLPRPTRWKDRTQFSWASSARETSRRNRTFGNSEKWWRAWRTFKTEVSLNKQTSPPGVCLTEPSGEAPVWAVDISGPHNLEKPKPSNFGSIFISSASLTAFSYFEMLITGPQWAEAGELKDWFCCEVIDPGKPDQV